ncbi:MAG: hemolysin III family protein [Clostridia bacterium]|nr:hemolysin III family protein [Clostridia bacterium]
MVISRLKTPRTALADRTLPDYTHHEELFNMITHIVGGAFALSVLVVCAVFAALHNNIPGVISGVAYGLSMMVVYVVSSVYHGLNPHRAGKGKRVMQVIDHCDIYGLIVGSFAPVALTGLKEHAPVKAWIAFGAVCAVSVVGIVFTAIDFKKYGVISYGAYFLAGWSVLSTVRDLHAVFSREFIILLIAGGLVYTFGMIFYVLEKKRYKYCHSVFHIFILAGSVLHFIAIFKYCI